MNSVGIARVDRQRAVRVYVTIAGILVVAIVGLWAVALWLGPASRMASYGTVATARPWGAVVFTLVFVVLGPRRGFRVSCTLFVLFLVTSALVIGGLAFPVFDPSQVRVIVLSTAAAYASMIALLRILSTRLERLVAAEARAALLAEAATTDPLTEVSNRRGLEEQLERLIGSARTDTDPLSVVLVDLDHFKKINDQYGHAHGDKVLTEVARRLCDAVRATDTVGRWGGEEFVVLAPRTNHDDAFALAERCAEAVQRVSVHSRDVSASLGVATLRGEDDMASLVDRADMAMYAAKRAGRGRVAAGDTVALSASLAGDARETTCSGR